MSNYKTTHSKLTMVAVCKLQEKNQARNGVTDNILSDGSL